MDERERSERTGIIESVMFMAGEPVKLCDIAKLFEISEEEAKEAMLDATETFEREKRGLQILALGDCYQLTTRSEFAPWIDKFTGVDRKKSLPNSLVETVAVIAYKQPITRAEVEYVRGVKCDYSVKKLLELGLIDQAGRKEVPGKPFLYVTTPKFLKTFGISSLEELPVVEVSEENADEE